MSQPRSEFRPGAGEGQSDKSAARKLVFEYHKTISDEERHTRSLALVQRIAQSHPWSCAKQVLLFCPMRSEPDLTLLWDIGALPDSTKVLWKPYPLENGGWGIRRFETREEMTAPNRLRIRINEGNQSESMELLPDFSMIEVAIVPGVYFLENGMRLGRGGGIYDRWLAAPTFRATTLGVCLKLPDAMHSKFIFPVDSHDRSVDVVYFA